MIYKDISTVLMWVSCSIGVPCNSLALVYFLRGKHHFLRGTTKLIYTTLCTTDLIFAVFMGCLAHLQSIPEEQALSKGNQVLCRITEFIAETCIRYSFFIVSLLAVIRARIIAHPLSSLQSPGKIGKLLILVVLILLTQSLSPVISSLMHGLPCPASFTNQTTLRIWYFLTVFLQAAFPLLLIVFANSISILKLLHVQSFRASCHMKAAKTTLMLTMTFFFLHITGVIYAACYVMGIQLEAGPAYIANGITCLAPAIDPCIYFLRLDGFCMYWKTSVKRFRESFKRNSAIKNKDAAEISEKEEVKEAEV